MKRIITFTEYLNESDSGGGSAFATGNAAGMGAIMTASVGNTPGSVSQSGSGSKGSGDAASYDYGKNFNLKVDKQKKEKRKVKKNKKEKPRYFTKNIEQNPTL